MAQNIVKLNWWTLSACLRLERQISISLDIPVTNIHNGGMARNTSITSTLPNITLVDIQSKPLF